MDNGREFIANIKNDWNEIKFKYTQLDKSTHNAFMERFNGNYHKPHILN